MEVRGAVGEERGDDLLHGSADVAVFVDHGRVAGVAVVARTPRASRSVPADVRKAASKLWRSSLQCSPIPEAIAVPVLDELAAAGCVASATGPVQ